MTNEKDNRGLSKAQWYMVVLMILSNLAVIYIVVWKIDHMSLQLCQDKLYEHLTAQRTGQQFSLDEPQVHIIQDNAYVDTEDE